MTGPLKQLLSLFSCLVLVTSGCSNSDSPPITAAPPATDGVSVTLQHLNASEVPAPDPLDPTQGTGIPEDVTAFRMTGLDDSGQLLYGPQTFARTDVVTLTGVPRTVTRLLIQYLASDGTVLARHLRKLALTSDTTVQVVLTDVHRHLTGNLPQGVPCGVETAAGLFDDWAPLFKGISSTQASYNLAFSDCETVRTQKVHALRIDLRDPDISFVSTPAVEGQPGYTQPQTVTSFVNEHQSDAGKLPVQVALNTNFFHPCCVTDGNVSSTVQLRGLSISEGVAINPDDLNVSDKSQPGAVSALFTRDTLQPGLLVSFVTVIDGTEPSVWEGVESAISGGNGNPGAPKPVTPFLLLEGVLQPERNPAKTQIAARTVVGFDDDLPPRFMYIVTIDGKEGSTSGAANFDSACWLSLVGAWDGFNLDGGGSTTLAYANQGKAQLIGTPYGDEKTPCLERLVGSVFGIRAKTIPNQVLPLSSGCPQK